MAGSKASPPQTEQSARVNKNRKGAGQANQNAAFIPRTPPPYRVFFSSWFPSRSVAGVICICLAFLFAGMLTDPEGFLVQILRDVIMSLIGRGAFIVSIFALAVTAYLCFRQSAPHPRRRILCAISFVLLFGMLQHLFVNDDSLTENTAEVLVGFYENGITGASGGFICGFLAAALRFLLGKGLSIVLLIILAILCLLGVMNTTPVGLIRALTISVDDDDDDSDGDDDDDAPDDGDNSDDGSKPSGFDAVAAFFTNLGQRIKDFFIRGKEDDDYFDDDDGDDDEDDDYPGAPGPRPSNGPYGPQNPGFRSGNPNGPQGPGPWNSNPNGPCGPGPWNSNPNGSYDPRPQNGPMPPYGQGPQNRQMPPYGQGPQNGSMPPYGQYPQNRQMPPYGQGPQNGPNSRPQNVQRPAPVVSSRLQDMMSQIDGDIEAPVAAAGNGRPPMPPAAPIDPDEDFPLFDMPAPTESAPVEQAPAVKKVTAKEAAASAAEVTAEISRAQKAVRPVYKFPPINLLKASGRNAADGTAEMKKNSARLNETLESFRIDAHIINVTRGPSVTRYEVELDKGVRLNKLTGVADDIALSLGVSSVRIAPVPGKISVVGIEVPNGIVTNVNLREVIDSREFKASASKSTFAVGKDIGGSCIVGNIAKMPHMLIAGTTGSGKSVCMNSIIISLLYKASPEDVKLIMVDPKMVELGIYNDIPHLLIPVVTDPKKAAGSLQWAVTEMMRRYKMMSDAGVRDLESFNSIVESDEDGEKLPQVVIIIDELADLMLVAAKEVEDSICRIAQMGRAAGMHLIIATQRPSADVITGLMKANIPSRIAFSVASAMESRIILDTTGAEKLVGKGDMLFAPIGTGKPQRVQGCFVTDAEVEAVATFVKDHFKATYDTGVMDEIEKSAINTGKKGTAAPEPEANAEELDGDEMLPAAVEVILETGQASVSMLQRRLKLGYARAARIVDEMEEKGIVGPFQGSKPRSILITKEQWEARKNGSDQMHMDDIPFDLDEDT